jgi:hypothetical protein
MQTIISKILESRIKVFRPKRMTLKLGTWNL